MEKEFNGLKGLSHPNIIQVFQMFVDSIQGWVYTVIEFFDGKEVLEVLSLGFGPCPESKAKKIFKEVMESIHFLHKNGIVHRDIKPNNILVGSHFSQVKVMDFNVAKFFPKGEYSEQRRINYSMKTKTGTVAFSAPEVLNGEKYSELVDSWGAGCVLYTLLCGFQPFDSEYLGDLVNLVKEGKVVFPEDSSVSLSLMAKELIHGLLQKDSEKRLTPKEALEHPWFE